MMKFIPIFAIALILSGCLYTTKIGFLIVKNDTNQPIQGMTRYNHEESFKDEFILQPTAEAEIEKYDIMPGTEDKVLESLAEIQVVQDDCIVNLNREKLKKNATYESVTVFIHIKPDLFASCAK